MKATDDKKQIIEQIVFFINLVIEKQITEQLHLFLQVDLRENNFIFFFKLILEKTNH